MNPQLAASQALQFLACGFTPVSLKPLGRRNMRNLVSTFTFLLSALWCLAAHGSTEDAAVLRSVLQRQCAASDGTYFVLVNHTHELSDFETAGLPRNSAAVADMLRRNKKVAPLPDGLACTGLTMATETQIAAALAEHPTDPERFHLGWEGFYARYPKAKGVLRLTLPGYSRGGDVATVLSSAVSGLRFSSGFLITLRKTRGTWKIVSSESRWIS